MSTSESLRFSWILRLFSFSIGNFRGNMDQTYPGFMDLITEIMPATVRLIEAIMETMGQVFPYWPMGSIANLHVPIDAVEARRNRLRGVGWCEFQINLLESTTNQSTMDWLPKTRIRQDTLGHGHCTLVACQRHNVNVSTYKQRHCVGDCTCLPLLPGQGRVEEILEQNQIPIICIKYDNGKPKVTVKAMSEDSTGDYVAISHVWVDGIGGASDTGLLRCQVLHLNTLVAKVTGRSPGESTNFWVDTLCIPENKSKMYTKALVGIRDVYTCAKLVLVVDRLVRQCSSTDPIEVLFASIYMSAWMQRMRTYEEAVLAKRLVFLLDNDEFFELTPGTTQPTMRPTVCIVWRVLEAHLDGLRINEAEVNICQIYRAFRFRLTNATGDEFLSIASMLKFDDGQMAALEQVEGEERVRDFWLMFRDIPADVVFTEGPKLSFPGFRWAPRTMMHPTETSISLMQKERSVCTKDGIIGSYMYLQFDHILQGCNAYPHKRLVDRVLEGDHRLRNQNFIIWVEGDRSTGHLEEKGMAIHVHCNDTWPAPPDALPFDGVIILTGDRGIPNPGQMWPGVALLRDQLSAANQGSCVSDKVVCQYVRRIFVERIRMEELAQKTPTIMYTGANYTIADARGTLKVEKLIIA